MSLTNEEQQQQNSLAKVKLAVDTVCCTTNTSKRSNTPTNRHINTARCPS
jgi:hypothetical protein